MLFKKKKKKINHFFLLLNLTTKLLLLYYYFIPSIIIFWITKKHKPPQIKIGALQQQLQQVSGSSSGCITETSVGPASVMVGNLVQGNRLAIAQGRDVGFSDDTERKVSFKFS